MFSVKGVSKKYTDKEIFSGIDYSFENRVYWLKGKNGIGKSVFCRCLVGLEDFTTGQVIGDLGKIFFAPDTALGEKWLTIDEAIDLMLFLYKIKISQDEKNRIKKILNLNDGSELLSCASVGTGMKIGLFLVFIRDFWDTIILDETLAHVDSLTKKHIINELHLRSKEGSVVIIINHDNLDFEYDIVSLSLNNDGLFEGLLENKGVYQIER